MTPENLTRDRLAAICHTLGITPEDFQAHLNSTPAQKCLDHLHTLLTPARDHSLACDAVIMVVRYLTKQGFLGLAKETHDNLNIDEYTSATCPVLIKTYDRPLIEKYQPLTVILTINDFSSKGHIIVTLQDLKNNPNHALELVQTTLNL